MIDCVTFPQYDLNPLKLVEADAVCNVDTISKQTLTILSFTILYKLLINVNSFIISSFCIKKKKQEHMDKKKYNNAVDKNTRFNFKLCCYIIDIMLDNISD